jgi:hypothetical protein
MDRNEHDKQVRQHAEKATVRRIVSAAKAHAADLIAEGRELEARGLLTFIFGLEKHGLPGLH